MSGLSDPVEVSGDRHSHPIRREILEKGLENQKWGEKEDQHPGPTIK